MLHLDLRQTNLAVLTAFVVLVDLTSFFFLTPFSEKSIGRRVSLSCA